LKVQSRVSTVSKSLVRFLAGPELPKHSVPASDGSMGLRQHRGQNGTQPCRSLNWGAILLVIVFCGLPVVLFDQTTPVVSWNTPASVRYGTALTSAQLNATATIPGTFAYSPVAGAILDAGSQSLSVTFTPTDTADYSTSTATVTLMVNQATPTEWCDCLRHSSNLDTTGCDSKCAGHLHILACSRRSSRRRITNTLRYIHTDRQQRLCLHHSNQTDDSEAGKADNHLGCACDNRLWDGLERQSHGCHGKRAGHVRILTCCRHGSLRRIADALGYFHAER
jgi:hypothetical protein